MPTYSETHHLNVDDAGQASVHVAVHLQDVNPQIAHLLVLRVLDAASEVAAVPEQGVSGQVIRPQTSGPCMHYGPYGCEVPRDDGQCPHLDNASIVCPIKDVLGAAQAYAPAEPESVEPEPDEAAIRRPRFQVGDEVRILHPTYKGYTGTIRRYYAATENYLLTIDGTRDTIWLSEQYLEVGA